MGITRSITALARRQNLAQILRHEGHDGLLDALLVLDVQPAEPDDECAEHNNGQRDRNDVDTEHIPHQMPDVDEDSSDTTDAECIATENDRHEHGEHTAHREEDVPGGALLHESQSNPDRSGADEV